MTAPAHIEDLVRNNLLLVHKIAQKYWGNDVEYEDLIGAGNIGLVKAAHRFEPKRGLQFTTYASFWIRALMFETLERIGGRRLSREERRAFYHETKARKVIGMHASDAAIAEYLGIREEAIISLRARRTFSLDAPARGIEGEDKTYGENTPDLGESTEDQFARAETQRMSGKMLAKAMKRLSPRERDVIHARFMAEQKKTLKEIGKRLSMSRERVRQIEMRALQKLRGAMGRAEE